MHRTVVTLFFALSVVSTFAFSVDKTPPAPPTPVVVKNFTTTAIPVNIAASQPFQIKLNQGLQTSFQVPAGKRLVIEFVSGVISGDVGARFLSISLETVVNATLTDHFFVPIFVGQDVSNGVTTDWLGFSQEARFYADPGTTVDLVILQNSSHTITGWGVAISGYLINVP